MHNAQARRQPREMWRDDNGQWRWSGEVTEIWEVICPDCGDDTGPTEAQPEAVRRLRGRYGSQAAATQAVKNHILGL
jgi:hypothetical protein